MKQAGRFPASLFRYVDSYGQPRLASGLTTAVPAPATATLGGTGVIDLTFTGLTPGVKYLGSVAYGGIAGLPNPTIVRVDP